jgi:hypothetical protein
MGWKMLGATVASLIALAVGALAPGAALGAQTRHCGNVQLNRFYHPAAHGLFGAFGINASGTTCTAAKKVAGKYASNPYAVGDKPSVKHVDGFACKWSTNDRVSQQVNVRCTRAGAKITFADRLPSG